MDKYPAPIEDTDGSWQEGGNEFHKGPKHALIKLQNKFWRDQNQARISKTSNELNLINL